MVRRRQIIIAFGAGALLAPFTGLSQPRTKTLRIGYLTPVSPQNGTDWRLQSFEQGLRELGYVEGKNYHIEVRWGRGKLETLSGLAAELVELKVDVIVAATSPSIMAALKATRTIPIVMPVSSDPVGDGLVASLARPSGNLTGLSVMTPEVGAKRIQILNEMFSKVSRPVAVLWNPAFEGMRARFKQAEVAAPTLGFKVRSLEVRDTHELDAAFEVINREHPDALLLLVDPFTSSQRKRIVDFVAEKRLIAMYESSEFPEVGGLISYGPNLSENYRRAAAYVDKIFKGAIPGELPIEQPTKFELVLNTKAARALGIKFPDSIMVQATKVID